MKKLITIMTTAALACGMLMGCGNDATTNDSTTNDSAANTYTTYSNETVWGKVTAVDSDGFKMDVGILDDDNVFAVNNEKADVTLENDTEIKLSALNDAMNDDNEIEGNGSIDDITVGDMVSVEYDSSGQVDTVKIMTSENNNQ